MGKWSLKTIPAGSRQSGSLVNSAVYSQRQGLPAGTFFRDRSGCRSHSQLFTGIHKECTSQSHGTAGSREAGGFMNSADGNKAIYRRSSSMFMSRLGCLNIIVILYNYILRAVGLYWNINVSHHILLLSSTIIHCLVICDRPIGAAHRNICKHIQPTRNKYDMSIHLGFLICVHF